MDSFFVEANSYFYQTITSTLPLFFSSLLTLLGPSLLK
ncbi:hypothetical protein Mgra_00006010, partial [Meloidogyne graminicola]